MCTLCQTHGLPLRPLHCIETIYLSICPSIYGSTTLVDLGRLFSFLILYTVGRIPWMGISPLQGRYLDTGQPKHRINAQRHSCLKKNLNSHKLLLTLASTAIHGFGPRRDPWSYFCSFLDIYVSEMRPPLRRKRGWFSCSCSEQGSNLLLAFASGKN
jgi:hypothetical protein